MRDSFFFKAKRKFNEITTLSRLLGIGPGGSDKISLVIYFDYEREFGNLDAKRVAQNGFDFIIRSLIKYGVKATWNCVGLVAEQYPHTILKLKDDKQEIASHTHSHIIPLRVGPKFLAQDLALSKKIFQEHFSINLQGFHPPEDSWSTPLISVLLDLGFSYTILRRDDAYCRPSYVSSFLACGGKRREVLRIPSICDDWPFLSEDKSPTQMVDYWLAKLSSLQKGGTGAIGFHPWVLGQDRNRLNAFEYLITKIQSSSSIELFLGRQVATWFKEQEDSKE
jgi:peptidoglycan/xylan/chitin deacetylase (PgdA/CDA1 family)